MAHRVILRDEALKELMDLGAYISHRASPAVANGYIDRLYAACMALAHFPERGNRRDDILPGLRTIAFERRATIIFRILDDQVEIVSIAYGGRNFESRMKGI